MVVGGGLIGCAVARAAALDGHHVTVVEARRPGLGASRAAAGMLAPLGEAGESGPFLDLARASLALYPSFVDSLRSESGIDPAYLPAGRIHVALDTEEEERLHRHLEWVSTLDAGARIVPPGELRGLLPLVTPEARAGLVVPGDHQVDNRLLTAAVVAAARRAGVHIVEGSPVQEVLHSQGHVAGVAIAGGMSLPAEVVVLAAGAHATTVRGLPDPGVVVPVRGQMVALGPLRGAGTRIVEGAGVYLVPRRWGRILVGATVERGESRNHVTPGGIASLLRGARRLLPALERLPATEVWSGLRPGTPDDLPILGGDPRLPGLIHATGHYRNGILLAPATAHIVTGLLAGRRPFVELEAFRPDRFPS